jgi:2,3-dihydroxybenzoate-AMP ligase
VLNRKYARALGEALLRTRPTHLFLATGTLLNLVRGPSAIASPLPSMEVNIVGSTLPRALAAEARKVLSPNVAVKYGATEAPGVAVGAGELLERHDGTAGYLLPTAEVEAVDADGKVLPPGTTGLLRIRAAGMITGYLNEPLNGGPTASALRDGWFYPGDLGSVSADGLVLVQGRASEVLNIGGDKFSPQAFEDVALGCAGIRDAAAFSVPDKFGVETPWIAVVRGVQVVFVGRIPRNGMGKIERQSLRQQAMASKTQAAT